MRLVGIGAVCALALTVTACSSDERSDEIDGAASEAASEELSAALDVPPCSDVWVAGETLPEDYEGCEEADGAIYGFAAINCEDGRAFTTYEGDNADYWAFVGDVINEGGADDSAYAEAFGAC